MFDFRDELRAMIKRAREIHDQEKGLVLESYKIIGYLESKNAAVNLGLSKDEFAASLGLSISVYWKRAQAGRIIRRFPKVEEMIQKDELQISHVNIIAPMITEANERLVLATIKNQPKRVIELAAASITPRGERIEVEPEIEIRLKFKKSQLEILDRAMEVLASSGKQPSQVETLVTALGDLLNKRDPMAKAKRVLKRTATKKVRSESPDPDQGQNPGPSPRSPDLGQRRSTPWQGPTIKRQRYVPNKIKHAVFLRDDGQCTYLSTHGNRCKEKAMLELDHKTMWCRGGKHSLENLTLRCRYHNQGLAKMALEREYLVPRSS